MSGMDTPPRKRIVLHIGTEKTGTTSIQSFLVENRTVLRSAGVLVPASPLSHGLARQAHRKLPAYAMNDERYEDVRAQLGIQSIARFRKLFSRAFQAECEASPASIVILSSEHLSSRLLDHAELARLKALLDTVGDTTVVVYLRRQEEMLLSGYSTNVLLGETRPPGLPGPRDTRDRFDYRALCLRWADVFGYDRIKVGIFDRVRLRRPRDLMQDFARLAEFSVELPGLRFPDAKNRSLDWRLLEFLRRFNEAMPHAGRLSGRPDPRRGSIGQVLWRLHGGQPVSLAPAVTEAFRLRFDDGNAFVARTFLNRPDGVLFGPQDVAPEAEPYDPDLTLAAAFKMFAAIWAEQQQPGSGAAVLSELRWPPAAAPSVDRFLPPKPRS